MKINIYDIFKSLKPKTNESEEFQVKKINDTIPHRIGISPEYYPIFFIECSDEQMTTDISLKLFKVLFNRVCKLIDTENNTTKKYTIIQLNSKNEDLQKYFFEVMSLVFEKLNTRPSINSLKTELCKVIKLFTNNTQISKDVIKGLWAELFIIERSDSPTYLIKSWHVSPEDKYDFNDGNDKIEVKATSNEERVHQFSLEQLNPNKGSRLLIASIILINSGIGKNIFDLIESISGRISDADTGLKLHEIVMQTIGSHIEESKSIFFDYTFAKDSIKFYDYHNIPKIKFEDIPPYVSGVHFSSCLKDIEETLTKEINSNLYKHL